MFKDLLFCNNGNLSLIDLTTMGDSSKREDTSKIGKFDSGLKYALVILQRYGIEISIKSNGIMYTFNSVVQSDQGTGKTKEVLQIIQTQGENTILTPTAFAINMGHEWELWMAIRELYSNCIDEKGIMMHELPKEDYDTVITLTGNDLLQGIIDNWDSYFIDKKTPICKSGGVSIYRNDSDFLKIYKNGILVYKNEDTSSRYAYDYPGASIDEMRVLNALNDAEMSIEYGICNAEDEAFIKEFMNISEEPCEFESRLSLSNHLSSIWVEIINEAYKESGTISTYKSLMNNFMDDTRIDIGVKKVAKKATSYYSDRVVVKTEEKREEVILTFEEEVKKICAENGFTVTLPIIISEISGMTCIGDVYKKTIHVTKDFSKDNVWEIIKAHYRILESKDPDAIYKVYAKQLSGNNVPEPNLN